MEESGVYGRASWTVGMRSFLSALLACRWLSQPGSLRPSVCHDPSIVIS